MKKVVLTLAAICGLVVVAPGDASALYNCHGEVEATPTRLRYETWCHQGSGLQRARVWFRQPGDILVMRRGQKVGIHGLSQTPWGCCSIDEAGIEHWTRDGEFVVYVCKIGCS